MMSLFKRCVPICLLFAFPILFPVAGMAIDIDISGANVTIEGTEGFLMEDIDTPFGTGWARFRWNSTTNMFYPDEYGFGAVHLQANFNDKMIDAPIGTGGAAVGEPVSVSPSITAIVRAEPMTPPSLEIQDNDDYSAGNARFEFLESAPEMLPARHVFTFVEVGINI